MPIPLLDLKQQYASIRDEVLRVTSEVYDSQYFILGPRVESFERDFAAYCHSKHCIGVSSGTDALLVALMVLGIGPEDEVIVPAYSFFATAGVVHRLGATPVFVDIDLADYNIDVKAIESRITARTRAIMPVHLYGQCAAMDEINRIGHKHGIAVIEDAAQAVGAEFDGRRAGALALMGCFSFFPSKNLGAFGDAGAVTCDDDELADRVARLRDHGRISKYEHAEVGWGERLDALQAAVLGVKLARLEAGNAARERLAGRYDQALAGVGDLVPPARVEGRTSARHLHVVRTRHRDELLAACRAAGVGAGIHYPIPLHLQPAWRHLGQGRGDLPATEAWAAECLSLPLYPELTDAQQDRVVEVVRGFFGER